MPEASLWYLGNVTFLNLSGNLLETLPPYPVLGAPALVSIDLSSNLLRELPEGSSFCEGDAGLKRLELRSNLFDNFSLAALNTCRNLSHLDLSGNVLSGLTGPARLPELRFLSLARNRLTTLDNPLLDCGDSNGDLDKQKGITCSLKHLDLSHNDLRSVTVEALGNLVTLETLSLLSNALNESDGLDLSRVFERLSKLKSLNLAKNLLTTVSTDHFAGLSSLETLDLSRNTITTVNFDLSTSLTLLTHLNLSSNQLTTFPARAALALTSLRVLDISGNILHHVTEVSLPQSILSVDLSSNTLRVFPKFVLLPGSDLQKVNVALNAIGRLDEEDLKALGSLRHLDVSRNALSFIHPASFSSLLRLRVLLLSHNRLDVNVTLAQHLFTPLVSLRMLSLSHNRISDAMALLPAGTLTTLVDLDASFNAIGQIPRRLNQWNGTMHLEYLRLEGCRLREVNEDAFDGLIYLRSVNIRHNLITHLPLFRSHPGVQYLLRGNPITCSCHVGWLKQTLVNVGGRIVSTQDYEVGECRTLPRGHLRAVRDIPRRDFLCVLPPALPACPPNCTCYSHNEAGDPEAIFCAGVGATSVPDLPPTTRVLSLEGGWIEKVGAIAGDEKEEEGGERGVQGRGRVLWYLEELYLNNSGVLTLSPSSFQGLPSLSVLELASNRLTELPSGVFQGLGNLTSLSLRGNRLAELPGNLFKDLKKLQALDLSHNSLSALSSSIVAELKAMPGLQRLSLAHNPWLCECRNSALYRWLKGNVSRADDFDVMSCKDEQTGLRWFFKEEEKVESLFHCEEEDDDLMVATVVLVIVFVVGPLIAALAFLGYKYRNIVSALLYSRCGCKCVKKKNEHEEMMVADRIVYDVCVLYDHSDRKCQWWVERILVPRLQSLSNGLRVHVPGLQQVGGSRGRVIQWQASSVPGSRGGTEDRRWLTDSNICGLRQSLACLVIVSKYFGAHTHTVTSFAQAAEQSQLRPSSLVMVTWGELTKQTLECGVRDFLGHSQHLPITAPFFWDRLLFLLPIPQRTPSHPSWHQLRRHSQSLIRACRFRSLSDVSAPSTEDRSTSTEFTDVTHHL